MSVSTSLDPVDTVIDILENATVGDFAEFGAVPTYIERQEETTQNTKGNRTDPAVYVYAPSDGAYEQYDVAYDRYVDTQVVTVDPWVVTSDTAVKQLHRDLRSILFAYVNDNQVTTQWGRIRPATPTPLSHETIASEADHYRYPLDIRLQGLRAP